MKLGKSDIDALVCPPDRKDMVVFDDALPGFGVRVTANGAKVFMFQYRRGGLVQRLRIGRYGDLTPAQARKLAEVARGEVAAGGDPVGRRKAEIDEERRKRADVAALAQQDKFTFERLIASWQQECLVHKSANYQREAPRALRRTLASILDVPAVKVDAPMLRRELAKIAEQNGRASGGVARGPSPESNVPGFTIQRRVRAYAHAMFAWGLKNDLVPSNPAVSVHIEGRSVARERALSEREVGEVWRCSADLGWPWMQFFQVLLLTLQREAEVAGMRWCELNEDCTRWDIPGSRTKNRRPHIVHLTAPVQAILQSIPRRTLPSSLEPSQFVFTTTGDTPLSGFSRAKERLDRLILTERIKRAAQTGRPAEPLNPWRIHDFRRSGATAMAELGVRWEVADRVLNHTGSVIQGVAAVYQRHDYLTERRQALEDWAKHVTTAGADPSGATSGLSRKKAAHSAGSNVIEMRGMAR